MNNYIVLDGYKYATHAGNWREEKTKPATERYTLTGVVDVTYGPATPHAWVGEIIAPNTARAAGWGTITELEATLAKKQAVSFTDHFGNLGSVHVLGPHTKRSLMNDWEADSNLYYIMVRLVIA